MNVENSYLEGMTSLTRRGSGESDVQLLSVVIIEDVIFIISTLF